MRMKQYQNPSADVGNKIKNVVRYTSRAECSGVCFRHKSRYNSCPPSSDITGNRLNSPTLRFAAAKGSSFSIPNKYNR